MIRHFLLFPAKEHKNTKGQAKRNESITGCDNRWKRGRIFSTCPYRNVSISLPAIPLLFSIPFYIVENRKDNKKKRRKEGKIGAAGAVSYRTQTYLCKSICVHRKIALDRWRGSRRWARTMRFIKVFLTGRRPLISAKSFRVDTTNRAIDP